jgi:hypothetical protein
MHVCIVIRRLICSGIIGTIRALLVVKEHLAEIEHPVIVRRDRTKDRGIVAELYQFGGL